MIELFALMNGIQNQQNADFLGRRQTANMQQIEEKKEDFQLMKTTSQPWLWILITLFIAFGTAYLAFECNDKETPATRFIITLVAFFFSGIYLIYYFIIYILLNKKCNGKDVSDLMKYFK
jgi:hypothetical protein